MDLNLGSLIAGLFQAGIAEVFGLAAIYKLRDVASFKRSLAEYSWARVFPRGMVASFAALFPTAELVVAVGLLVPATAEWASTAALLISVGLVASVALDERDSISHCGCWGTVSPDTPRVAFLTRAIAVFGLAAASTVGIFTTGIPAFMPLMIGAFLVVPVALLVLELPQFMHLAISQREAWRLT
jgi:hypothetical protein